jgi:AbrB family looped-hinge helix DNA binding protein
MASVQIDQAGRIVLPKPLRDLFRLRRGDTLRVEVRGDVIELRPARKGSRLGRINGVLVLASETPLEKKDFVAESRDDRIDALALESKRLE